MQTLNNIYLATSIIIAIPATSWVVAPHIAKAEDLSALKEVIVANASAIKNVNNNVARLRLEFLDTRITSLKSLEREGSSSIYIDSEIARMETTKDQLLSELMELDKDKK